jgi:Tol biopolymer transport system component
MAAVAVVLIVGAMAFLLSSALSQLPGAAAPGSEPPFTREHAIRKATDLDRLVVRDLVTGTDRDLTPEPGCSYTSVRWSPDGKSLAFVKYRSELDRALPTELWCIDADGGNLRLLYRLDAGVPGARGPALSIDCWSADGRYL